MENNLKVTSKKGQVWIETVIYLLIGLGVIGVLLAFIKPQIDEAIDKNIIEKSIDSLNKIDSLISEISYVPGNSRTIILALKKGSLFINTTADTIKITVPNSKHEYSEIGRTIEIPGTRIQALTNKTGEVTTISLVMNYNITTNITHNEREENAEFKASETSYNLIVRNLGSENRIINIDFTIPGQ
ncbi:MAG: hypothetical protein AABW73_02150 [Nanoarchaeota archaeon]